MTEKGEQGHQYRAGSPLSKKRERTFSPPRAEEENVKTPRIKGDTPRNKIEREEKYGLSGYHGDNKTEDDLDNILASNNSASDKAKANIGAERHQTRSHSEGSIDLLSPTSFKSLEALLESLPETSIDGDDVLDDENEADDDVPVTKIDADDDDYHEEVVEVIKDYENILFMSSTKKKSNNGQNGQASNRDTKVEILGHDHMVTNIDDTPHTRDNQRALSTVSGLYDNLVFEKANETYKKSSEKPNNIDLVTGIAASELPSISSPKVKPRLKKNKKLNLPDTEISEKTTVDAVVTVESPKVKPRSKRNKKLSKIEPSPGDSDKVYTRVEANGDDGKIVAIETEQGLSPLEHKQIEESIKRKPGLDSEIKSGDIENEAVSIETNEKEADRDFQKSYEKDKEVSMATEPFPRPVTIKKPVPMVTESNTIPDKIILKKAETGESSTDLDFSVITTTSHLDSEANKQKTALSKQGSLAQRRRPTRKNIKSTMVSSELTLFEDSTEPRPKTIHFDEDHDYEKLDEDDRSPTPAATPKMPLKLTPIPGGIPLLKAAGRPMPGIKTPLQKLPGLGTDGKPKLKPAVKTKPALKQVEGKSSEAPGWLSKLRRKPDGDKPDKMKLDQEPEKPAWMKDALEKTKRTASIIETSKDSMQTEKSETSTSKPVEDDKPNPPWMVQLRRSGRNNRPIKTQQTDNFSNNKENSTNNSNIQRADTISHHKTGSSGSEKELLIDFKNLKDSPRSESPFLKNSPRSSGRESPSVKSSSRRSSLSNGSSSPIIDENRTPLSDSNDSFNIETDVILRHPNKKNSPRSTNNMETEDSNTKVPLWKQELQKRKTINFTPSPINQSNKTPIRMSEVPKWKRDLAEKKKSEVNNPEWLKEKKEDQNKVESDSTVNTPVPLWKQELAKKREKRASLSPQAVIPTETSKAEPEWKKQAQIRRARLVKSGIINPDSIDSED
ncbi:unnamed protein product [Owenia fusiformis]|uniref:Uncharacterized protein n=1 Tax=Owenia fusiformis TaxID=6347 RepID=A0A8J1TLB9_OWEFU|nr:unnamed protein product [Owenia fusiformis]